MKSKTASKKQQCAPKPPPAQKGRSVALPIIDPDTGMKRSRAGRWRTYSLAAVHVLMIAHFVQWMVSGNTFTPIEPSESMETIREGKINMGFIFFGLAILSTFVLGRWVCGWGCHMVAYQDLTNWILKKLHLRPKAFRTRWLFLFTTVVLAAGWMFFVPLGARIWSMIQGAPQPTLEMHLTRTGFWDTFPGPFFGILTVLIAGMAIIYFLGAKGFCTYACPYGAVFGFADKFAPARIRVTDACTQCGHCSAVCTSNVRVSEEVNLYKMVVDPGCMKCLDCVEVCPNDALYVGFGRPSFGAKPAAPRKPVNYDLTFVEEIIATILFVLVLMTVNGLYGGFPFLLSLAMAGIMTYLFMKAGRAMLSPDAMMQKVRLKVGGKFRPAGVGFMLIVLGLAGLTAHSAVWRYHDYFGTRAFDQVRPRFGWQYTRAGDLAQSLTDAERASADAAMAHLEACERWGLLMPVVKRIDLAYAYVLAGRTSEAMSQVRAAASAHSEDALIELWQARMEVHAGDAEAARASFAKAREIERRDREPWAAKSDKARFGLSSEIWAEYGRFLQASGDIPGAVAAYENAVKFDPGYYISRLWLIDGYLAANRIGDARRAAIGAIENHLESPELLARMKEIRMRDNDPTGAIADYRTALKSHPDHVVLMDNLGASLAEAGQFDDAAAVLRRAIQRYPDSRGVRTTLGGVLMMTGDYAGALKEFETVRRISEANPDDEWKLLETRVAMTLAECYARLGRIEDARRELNRVVAKGSAQERSAAEAMLAELVRMGNGRPGG